MKHIDTYKILLDSPEWPRLQFQLEELDRRLQHKPTAVKPWPKVNFGSGFVRLVNQALTAYDRRPSFGSPLMPNQLDLLLDRFNEEMKANPNGAARTVWRSHYDHPDLGISAEGKSVLHWIGIEAYHYNLAMAAVGTEESLPTYPGVITRHSYLFEELNEHSIPDMEDGCAPQEIPTPSVSRTISRKVIRMGRFLGEAVKNGTELNNSKIDYLLAVQSALLDRRALPEATLAAKAYSEAIVRHAERHFAQELASPWEGSLEYVTLGVQGSLQTASTYLTTSLESKYGVIGKAASDFTSNVIAPMVGLLVRDGAGKLKKKAQEHEVHLVVDQFDNLPEYQEGLIEIEESLQGAQWFGLMKIKPKAAKEHVKQLPAY